MWLLASIDRLSGPMIVLLSLPCTVDPWLRSAVTDTGSGEKNVLSSLLKVYGYKVLSVVFR